jgi:hypothetical protein
VVRGRPPSRLEDRRRVFMTPSSLSSRPSTQWSPNGDDCRRPTTEYPDRKTANAASLPLACPLATQRPGRKAVTILPLSSCPPLQRSRNDATHEAITVATAFPGTFRTTILVSSPSVRAGTRQSPNGDITELSAHETCLKTTTRGRKTPGTPSSNNDTEFEGWPIGSCPVALPRRRPSPETVSFEGRTRGT